MPYNMPTVYLAGGIKGLSYDEATDWREYAADYLADFGIAALSPMRAKDYLRNEDDITNHYLGHPLSTAKGITMRDHRDVKTCDLMLAYLLGAESRSLGTAVEFGFAHAYQKPVVMVDEEDGLHASHGMLQTIAGVIVPTLDEALDLTVAILDPRATSSVMRKQYEITASG